MRAAFRKTALVVDEGSLASTVQARDLLRIADALRIPKVVLVGDEKQLDAVGRRQALRPAPEGGHEDRRHGRDHAPARPGAEGGGRGEPRGRRRAGVREARRQHRGSETRQPRGRRRRALARAVAGGARQRRPHGPEPRAPREHQRHRARASGARRDRPRPRAGGGAAGLAQLHQCREDARGELQVRRHGRVPPPPTRDWASKRATSCASGASTAERGR